MERLSNGITKIFNGVLVGIAIGGIILCVGTYMEANSTGKSFDKILGRNVQRISQDIKESYIKLKCKF